MGPRYNKRVIRISVPPRPTGMAPFPIISVPANPEPMTVEVGPDNKTYAWFLAGPGPGVPHVAIVIRDGEGLPPAYSEARYVGTAFTRSLSHPQPLHLFIEHASAGLE